MPKIKFTLEEHNNRMRNLLLTYNQPQTPQPLPLAEKIMQIVGKTKLPPQPPPIKPFRYVGGRPFRWRDIPLPQEAQKPLEEPLPEGTPVTFEPFPLLIEPIRRKIGR